VSTAACGGHDPSGPQGPPPSPPTSSYRGTVTAGERTRKRVRMDYDERRESILRVAQRLFHKRSYGDVSVREIAEAAGVATGLLHHYFGSKRDLYLEVLRSVARVPDVPIPDNAAELTDSEVWRRSVDGLIDLIEDHAELWLSSISMGSADRDQEIATILDDSREVLAEQTIAALGLQGEDSPELRALVRGYGGLVQEIILEWLGRRRLTKAQVREILLRSMPLLLEHVRPHLSSEPGT
jgi:AcrR family transcriptional regulator